MVGPGPDPSETDAAVSPASGHSVFPRSSSITGSLPGLAGTPLSQIVETVARAMGMSRQEIERRKAFLGFTERDVALLLELHDRLSHTPDAFAEAFYAHLLAFDETRSFLSDPATVARLKQSQAAYFESLTAGAYGLEYAHHRLRVGVTHHRIGLGPKWYIGAYHTYLSGLLAFVWETAEGDLQKAIETVQALVKIVFFDIGLTLDTYTHVDRWTIAELQAHAQRIVTSIPSGLLVLSADLRVLFANRQFLEVVGVSPDRVVGMPLEAFFPGIGWWDHVARVLAGFGHAHAPIEIELAAPRGTRHLQIRLATIDVSARSADEQGEDPARLLLVLDDVTERKQTEAALQESQRSLSTLISNLPGLVYRCANDRDWTVEFMSQGAFLLTGYPSEAFVQKTVTYGSLIHHDDAERVWTEVQEAVGAGKAFDLVYRLHTARGEEKWVWERGRGVFAEDGALLALEGLISDVTDRKRAEEAVRDGEERYRNLVENAHDMIQSLGPDGRLLFVNRAWLETMGYAESEISSLNFFRIVHPQSRVHCQQLFAEMLAGRATAAIQAALVAKDGRVIEVEGNVTSRYENDRVVATQAIFRNVTEHRAWEERLKHAVSHDPLTNLPNRTVFMDRLSQALVRVRWSGKPVAVFVLDLDRFKLVNDTLGHASGDRLLLAVAERLTGCLRDGDTVARLGGDEFAILLPEIAKASDSVTVVEKMFTALQSPFVIDDHELFVTTSIGMSIAPDDGEAAGVLVKNADTAMYRAKDQGRNTYQLYSPSMNVSTMERLSLEGSLRHALDRCEFVVYYQPQVDLRTGRICGMEALVRWQHPDLGLVSPAKFIPLAEETGLIVPIGEVVLRASCAQNRTWQKAGFAPFPVSVNLSARQFQHPNLKDVIARILRETELDPKWLDLEMTESLLMDDAERTVGTLVHLHAMGIRLSIDDFGVGYSSLNYLKRFPIDTVKIDQSFVRHITSDADDAAIATAIIAMAHSLKLKVVAEGVETDDQMAFLNEKGCDAVQGYLFSRPLAADAMTALLAQGQGIVTIRPASAQGPDRRAA